MAARSHENIVSSYFYYMWNAWSKEECRTVFGPMHKHFWEKWCHCANWDLYGAAERFYAELSDSNRHRLVERACELYDGKAEYKAPKDSIRQPKECVRRPVMVIRNAPQSLAAMLTACNIPFACSFGKFILFDSSSVQTVKEYLESRGVPPAQIEAMSFSQHGISINDIESV